jgi:BNR/Asp-box repeat
LLVLAASVQWQAFKAGPLQSSMPRIEVGSDVEVTNADLRRNFREPHLAVNPNNPNHLIVAAMRETTRDQFVTEILVSFDGGATWKNGRPAVEMQRGDPWLALGRANVAYCVTLPRMVGKQGATERMGIYVYRSTDGGQTWSLPVEAPFDNGGSYDKTSITVDTTGGPFDGQIYVLASQGWTDQSGNRREGIIVARSTDQAASFTVRLRFGPNNNLNHGVGHPPVVMSDGTLVVPFFDIAVQGSETFLKHSRLWALTSRDGGLTAAGAYLVAESVAALFPFVAVDRSALHTDRLYIAWTGPEGDSNIYVARSDDYGKTWSQPVQVNQPGEPRRKRYKPVMAVDPRGVVGVAWRDSRVDSKDRCTHVYFSASTDGGETFVPDVRVSSGQTCSDDWWGGDGEYFGLAARGQGQFHLVWPDNRSGFYQLRASQVRVRGR